MRFLLATSSALLAITALASVPVDADVRGIAEKYLRALTGEQEEGKELLLGGATVNAQLFSLQDWRILAKDPVMKEEGDLASARKDQEALDQSGQEALAEVLHVASGTNEPGVQQIGPEEAAKLLAPTRTKAAAFTRAHPVLAFVMRVDKEVYWNPKNPMRAVLADVQGTGRYSLEVHRFKVESREGPRAVPRQWPLRILRFRAGKLDTGWRVLPASDWNAE